MSRSLLRSATALGAVAGVLFSLGAAAPAHAAIDKQLVYQCKFPIIAPGTISMDIQGPDIPSRWPIGEPTPEWVITAKATLNAPIPKAMSAIDGLASIEGKASAKADLSLVRGGQTFNVAANVNMQVPKVPFTPTEDSAATLDVFANGSAPSQYQDDPAVGKIVLRSIAMNMVARDASGKAMQLAPVTRDWENKPWVDSDNNPDTFDVVCRLNPTTPGQTLDLADIEFFIHGDSWSPTPPLEVAGTEPSRESLYVKWDASTDPDGDLKGYKISLQEVDLTTGDPVGVPKTATVAAPATNYTFTGLKAGTAYDATVIAYDEIGNESDPLVLQLDTLPAGNDAPPTTLQYAASGTTQIKTLSRGTLPIKGGLDAQWTESSGAVEGDLAFEPTSGRLTALGFLPVTAKLAFVPSGKTTGTLKDGRLETTSKVRIKVQEAKLFGAIPLVGGNSCQTKQLSEITLKSTQAAFDPKKGGPVAGTYAISDLNGCGALNGLVSPLAAGVGNTLKLDLSQRLPAVPTTPGAPELVGAAAQEQITLTWAASTAPKGIRGYDVYVGGTKRATAETNTATLTGLKPGTSYGVKVVAISTDGAASEPSPEATLTTAADTTPPTAPVVTAGPSSTSVLLGWSGASDANGIAGYEIYEGTRLVVEVDRWTYQYSVTGLLRSTDYTFSVVAKDAAGNRSSASASVVSTRTTAGSGIDKQLVYQCKFPIIAPGTISMDIQGPDIPSRWPIGEPTPEWVITAKATLNAPIPKAMSAIDGLASIEGKASAKADLSLTRGGQTFNVAANVNMNVPKVPFTPTEDSKATLDVFAFGSAPSQYQGDGASGKIVLRSIAMNMVARDASGKAMPLAPVTRDWDNKPWIDSDANPDTFDVVCRLDPSTPNQTLDLAFIEFFDIYAPAE